MALTKLPSFTLLTTDSFTFANLTLTSNITAGNANLGNATTSNYYIGNGSLLTSLTGANVTGFVPNANVSNTAYSVAGANVTGAVSYATTANAVAGANVSGQVGNALVAGTVYTAAQPNITSVGTLTSVTISGDGSIGGNVTITGNLIVSGTQTTVNSTTVSINDVNIVLANNATTSAEANGAGITINGASANILYVNTSNAFVFSHPISANGNLLTSLTGANVTGFVPNANVANTAYAVAVANVTGIGNIATINKDGNASNILYGNGVFAAAPAGGGGGSGASVTVSATAPSTPTQGDLWLDSESGELNVYFGGAWASVTESAPQLSSIVDSFTGDGGTSTFTLSTVPTSTSYTFVTIGGILQPRNAYSLAGNVLTTSSAVPASTPVEVTTLGGFSAAISAASVVLNNAQPNITSVGTLTGLSVAGNLTVTGNSAVVGNCAVTGNLTINNAPVAPMSKSIALSIVFGF